MAYVTIVDDDEDFASAAAIVLRNSGHDVQIELNPAVAVANMEKRRPDLVIMDVMFPEDSSAGFAMAREMRRAGSSLANVPILLLTAINARFPLGFSSNDIDNEWLPVSDFLEKPLNFEQLQRKVSELLEKASPSSGSRP
jgi:DNA-binding response OmpR family regulator